MAKHILINKLVEFLRETHHLPNDNNLCIVGENNCLATQPIDNIFYSIHNGDIIVVGKLVAEYSCRWWRSYEIRISELHLRNDIVATKSNIIELGLDKCYPKQTSEPSEYWLSRFDMTDTSMPWIFRLHTSKSEYISGRQCNKSFQVFSFAQNFCNTIEMLLDTGRDNSDSSCLDEIGKSNVDMP